MDEIGVEITFTVTTEYAWSGDISELPAYVRKGGKLTKREDGETVLNEDALSERLDDEILSKLIKHGNTELQNEEFEVGDVYGS